jgi:PilZ domain-containing protein
MCGFPKAPDRSKFGRRMFQVHTGHPRARRYPFVAGIELTDAQSETQIRERTSDLSVFGCHVDTPKLFAAGTRVRIRIAHRGANFAALGTVVYAGPNAGMGVAFTKIEQKDQLVLEKWIDELRDEEGRRSEGH